MHGTHGILEANNICINRLSQDNVVRPDVRGQNVLEFCIGCNLLILNVRARDDKTIGKFTCHQPGGKSVVDYVLLDLNMVNMLSEFYITDELPFTDHAMLSMKLTMQADNAPFQNGINNIDIPTGTCNQTTCHKFRWGKDKEVHLQDTLRSDNIQNCLNDLLNDAVLTEHNAGTINSLVINFSACLQDVVDRVHGKAHKVRLNNNINNREHKWYDIPCKRARNTFSKAVRRNILYPSDLNRYLVKEARDNYKIAINKAKTSYDNKVLSALLEALETNNTRDLWSQFKGPRTKNNLPNPDELYTHFKNLSAVNRDVDIMDLDGTDHLLDQPITKDEVERAIKMIKRNKAVGVDGLRGELEGGNAIIMQLTILFNVILHSGQYPETWSLGYIVPIHKSGPTNVANNFRGITILSVFGKLFSIILNTRLSAWCDAYSIISESQAGFRSSYSTIDQIYVLNAVVNHLLHKGSKLYAAFIDFSKAFDLVDRTLLLQQLSQSGLSGKILHIIKSMYERTKSCVNIRLDSLITSLVI